jgi:hypothetical protein
MGWCGIETHTGFLSHNRLLMGLSLPNIFLFQKNKLAFWCMTQSLEVLFIVSQTPIGSSWNNSVSCATRDPTKSQKGKPSLATFHAHFNSLPAHCTLNRDPRLVLWAFPLPSRLPDPLPLIFHQPMGPEWGTSWATELLAPIWETERGAWALLDEAGWQRWRGVCGDLSGSMPIARLHCLWY